jgi:MoxR-like ATPase
MKPAEKTDEGKLRAEAKAFGEALSKIHAEVGRVIVGQERVIECTVAALLSGGNVLLEGVPGLGKTELVKALSRVLDLHFNRIQFTPDLMPADIIGTNVMSNDGSGNYRFEFRKGPLFTQLLLADEINRATPKTQSALLETMQEGTITTAGETHRLTQPFFVLATQNPLEQEGTYPLPEAQLDRFMYKIDVPFQTRAEMNEVVNRTILREPVEVNKVMDGPGILQMRHVMDHVVVAEPIRDYAVRLVLGTHPDSELATDQVRRFVKWGASPRAAQALIRGGRVRALADGRPHLAFEDVRYFAREVLQHRVLLNYDGQAEEIAVPSLVDELVSQTPEAAQ